MTISLIDSTFIYNYIILDLNIFFNLLYTCLTSIIIPHIIRSYTSKIKIIFYKVSCDITTIMHDKSYKYKIIKKNK